MSQRPDGARRRKAFADFKENQYNDSFSISSKEKTKIMIKELFKYVIIVIVTLFFIGVGFIISDALINISSEAYNDPNTYTASTTTTDNSTTLPTSSTSASSEQSSEDISIPEQQ